MAVLFYLHFILILFPPSWDIFRFPFLVYRDPPLIIYILPSPSSTRRFPPLDGGLSFLT